MANKLNIEELIRDEIELDMFYNASSEVTKENAKVFIRMLQKHIDTPSSKGIKDIVLENIQSLNKSIDILIKNKNLIYSTEDIESLFDIMKASEEYFNKYGLEREMGKQLRKSYLKVNNYLQTLREPLYTEKDLNCPNEIYLSAYRKFLSENISRVNKGLNPKTKPKEWNIDSAAERGELEILALEDSLRHLKSGIDFSQHRGDLRYLFGTKTRGQLADELLSSVSNEILNKNRQKLIKEIRRKEGIQIEELSEEQKLAKAIVAHAKRNIR